MIKIWEGYKKQNKRVKKLPIIVPLVIYHGAEKWNVVNSIMPLFEEIPGTKPYIPDFKAEVFDISHIPDDRIKGEILLRVHLLIQKYIFKPELFEKLEEIFKLLITLSSKTKATEYLEVLLRYLTASIDSKKSENLKTEIEKLIKAGGDIMPTIAEKWVSEGKKERDIEICEKLIERSMNNAEIRNITGLSIKKIEEIRKSLLNK